MLAYGGELQIPLRMCMKGVFEVGVGSGRLGGRPRLWSGRKSRGWAGTSEKNIGKYPQDFFSS